MFRRTRATRLYHDGVELELISRILGHSSTETTKIYTVASIGMLTEARGRIGRHRRKTIMGRKRG
ncbi:MAG: tyrosine-type recombinase/integrase [Lachnospiraceae bacterium]|nr:tyrosine-type recombinase/integrase [Lachnospiraceae bacterium]